jgi:hypothetical protein
VGERVWVWLRPGLCLADLEGRLDKIAVACWASTVVVERASEGNGSEGNAAYLRIDVKRREVLTGKVVSPLVALVDPDTPKIPRPVGEVPTALNLGDVTDAMVTPTAPAAHPPRTSAANGKAPAATPPADADDVTDWI